MGKTRYPQSTEAQVQKAIITYLQLKGWLVAHIPNGGRDAAHRRQMARQGAVNGWPDLVAIDRQGQTLWVEVKTAKGRISPAQKAVISELEARGCQVLVARSLDDVVEYLALVR